MDVESEIIMQIVRDLLPVACRKHTADIAVSRSLQMVDDGEYIYVTWKFYNDERVRLKLRVVHTERFSYRGIRLEPMNIDFEEWRADAIMRCDVGKDVIPRPKHHQYDLFWMI